MATRRADHEGTIGKLANGRWRGAVQIVGTRQWVYGKTRKEVADKLRAKKPSPPKAVGLETLADLLKRDLAESATRLKPSTVHGYEQAIRLYLAPPPLGPLTLGKITTQRITDYYGELLGNGLSARRVQIIHAVLHRALARAEELGLIARNPARLATVPRSAQSERTVWTAEKASQFLASCLSSNGPYSHGIALSLLLGLRQAELLGLSWSDFSPDLKWVTISRTLQWVGTRAVWGEPKSKSGRRTLPVPQFAREILVRTPPEKRDGCMVVSTLGTTPRKGVLNHALTRLCRDAQVPDIGLHGLRHQHASLLLAGGASVKQVQVQLGHADPAVTLRTYAHVLSQHDDTAARIMDGLIPQQGG